MADRSISGAATIAAPVRAVYQALIEPDEQVRWNSLYRSAALTTPGPVRSGSVMHGDFVGTGKAVVDFADVVPGEQFVHVSTVSLRGVGLGGFRHRYQVRAEGDATCVTQTVTFKPKGLGRLLAPVIMRSFRQRLPASFDELGKHFLVD